MNPFHRDEQARPRAYKPKGNSILDAPSREVTYNSDRGNRPLNFVLSHPRSGSTLLMRLMNLACYTQVVGDRTPDYYKSLIGLWKSFRDRTQYGRMCDFESSGKFAPHYGGETEKHSVDSFFWSFRNMMAPGFSSCGFSKTTIVGFGNNLVKDYIAMIRDFAEHAGYPVNVVFLFRNHDDIIKSFESVEWEGKEKGADYTEAIKELLLEQQAQFREEYELGDIILKYEDLIIDPIQTLLKLKPSYYPFGHIVKQVMERKIRC